MEFLNLLGRGPTLVVEAALLACLFWTALVKPERITGPGKFRLACSLLGVEFVVPALINLYYFRRSSTRRTTGSSKTGSKWSSAQCTGVRFAS